MKNILLTILFIVVSLHGHGQEIEFPFPSFSPKGNTTQTVGNTLIKIKYERPSVRKRQVFGELVPWNKVWRTGAGNCTKIRFDNNVTVGGQEVASGYYSIFTIPNPKNDVARFVVLPKVSSRFYKTLNFDIELSQHNAEIYMSWANTQINFTIETSTNRVIDKIIREELLTEKTSCLITMLELLHI